jgi:hypothetical protein
MGVRQYKIVADGRGDDARCEDRVNVSDINACESKRAA